MCPIQTSLSRFSERMRVFALILFFLIPLKIQSDIIVKIPDYKYLESHYPESDGLPTYQFFIPSGIYNGKLDYSLISPQTIRTSHKKTDTKYPLSYIKILEFTGNIEYNGQRLASFIIKPALRNGDSIILYRELVIHTSNDIPLIENNGYISSLLPSYSTVNMREDSSYSWQKPVDIPLPGDSKVDYVIVTDSVFINQFKQYQDFWWLMGLRTKTVTIQRISEHYDGISIQNKIRKFLQDAVTYWGTKYVLLAGDNNTIPIIYFHNNFYGKWLDSPTDMYYSCLAGNWNADFDYYLGEAPSDSVDLMPDVALGRLSINTYDDVSDYFSKLKSYILHPDTSIIKKALFMGANLFSSGDGKMWCDTISQYHFPNDYYKVVLSEIDGTSAPGNSNQAVIDSLNKGFYFYYHNSHGSHSQIQLKNSSPRVYLTNNDIDSLNNSYPNIVFVVSCYTNEFPFDVLGEHWVLQQHGAIGYIASINDEFPYPAMYFEKPFFDSLFNSNYYRIGDILNLGKLPILGYAQTDGVYRSIYLFESLEGDPAVPVWRQIPKKFNILNLPDTITQGDSFSVQIFSDINDKINCNMITPDDHYIHKTLFSNHVSLFHPTINTPGNLIISFYHKGYIPLIDTIVVMQSPKIPEIIDFSANDSLNKYPDNILENGDTVILNAKIVNHDSTPYSVYINSTDDISLLNSVFHENSTYPNDTAKMTFKIYIPYTVKNRSVPITFHIPNIYIDTVYLEIKSPLIVQSEHNITENTPGKYKMTVELQNRGKGNGFDYAYVLSATEGTKTIFEQYDTLPHIFYSDSTYSINPIDFTFLPGPNNSINDIEFKLMIIGMNDTSTTTFYYDTLPTSEILTSIPYKKSIKLIWNDVPGTSAYDLYVVKDSDFIKINRDPIKDGTFYTVNNLATDSTYRFAIRGYDKYMNPSNFSDLYYESTNPIFYDNWPINNSDISLSSIITADFSGDGNIEIFEAFKSGKLLMTYLSGDTVSGWPQYIEGEIWGTPAVADVDNDGKLEIVVAPWSSSNKVYMFSANGTIKNGWPRYVQGDPTNKGLYGVAGSPVIRDINGDGTDEIIIGATNGDIFIWESNGAGFFRNDGLFAKREGDSWDLNVVSAQDPDEDSIYTIYALSRIGEFYEFSTTQYDSDSLAIPLSGTPDTLLGGTYYQPTIGKIGPHQGKDITLVAGYALYLFNDSLTLYPNFPIQLKSNVFISQPVLYDVDNDGYKDIILSVGDSIFCYNYQGNLLDNYPYKFGTAMQSSPVAGTLNDTPYIFIGTGDLTINAFSLYGEKMRGFPIETEDNFYCAPSVGDSVLAASDYASNTYLWKIPLQAPIWPSIYHDFQHTGDAEFPLSDVNGLKQKNILKGETNVKIHVSFYNGIFKIKGITENSNFSVKIYDLSGRNIDYKRISYNTLKLSYNKNGVYFIKIDSDKIKYTGKFLFLK